jgi:hypothetical protein
MDVGNALVRLWLRRALRRFARQVEPFEFADRNKVIRRLAPGRSFLDVGGMWGIDGRDSFTAEEAGATQVTLLDEYCTEGFRQEQRRRSSRVRYVDGDLHDADARAEAGVHDVVWCAGVHYHVPNPVQTLQCLRQLGREHLVLITVTLPELPGLAQAAVFWPLLPERDRHLYARAYEAVHGAGRRTGLTVPFDAGRWHGNWWWGLTPSAVAAMLAVAGCEVSETSSDGFNTAFVTTVDGA